MKIKKYLIFALSLVLLIIFTPSNVFAENGYTQLWKRFYKDINYSQLEHSNNYDINYISLRGGARGSVFLYPQGFTFNQKSYDYISGAGMVHSESLGGVYIEDYHVSSSVTASFGLGLSLMVEGNEGYGNDITRGSICTIYPTTQTNDEFYFTYNCPIINTMGKIVQFKFILHNNCDTILNQTCDINSNYYFSVGIGPTINAHLLDNTQQQIYEAQEQTKDAINDMNNNITNSDGNSNNDNSSAIQGFQNELASNSTITSLFVMPITFFQAMLNSVNGTCSPFNIGDLFGKNITFPCINMQSILGSTLWGVIDTIISAFFIWGMSKRFISIFSNMTSMKDGRDEVGS